MAKKIPEEGYKSIFNCSPAAILIIAADAPRYTILDVNNAYLSATNATREELIGQPVFGAFPANPTDEVSKNIERSRIP
jgi:PAS domain S-box-containing protein